MRRLISKFALVAGLRQEPGKLYYVEGLNELGRVHWTWVEAMGWHNVTVLEKLALLASEFGEAVNECRGDKPTKAFGSELADIVLRTVDIAHAEGIDLDGEIAAKMQLNAQRGTRGRKK
jgi:NTP pyrophosphatase (non-canonical NTP hydrolase)